MVVVSVQIARLVMQTESEENRALLESLAAMVGTPFWLYEAGVLRRRIGDVRRMTAGEGVQARFAMKACPATRVLREMRRAGIWIDAVSGNEMLRALRAGYAGGQSPPEICFTADVFRDNALDVLLENRLLPNVGSPGMMRTLADAGYAGAVSIRVNPGFGHGHVNACDTGGPSSKHGIWFEDLPEMRAQAAALGLQIVMLHSHIGSGPRIEELRDNLDRLATEFAELVPSFPDLEAVSLGGGIPHDYRDPSFRVPVDDLAAFFSEARERIAAAAGRPLRLEIEPGRYFVAPAGRLVARVTDVKRTRTNAKGSGETFVMVDAGFVDLVRPAMYGSYHRISVPGSRAPHARVVVAGPLCESGDVFTQDDTELLLPRELPMPEPGDLLVLHDAGAYGYAMSSNYNSVGRAPQLWQEEDGSVERISCRETIEDILRAESDPTPLLGPGSSAIA